jgi:hypothetical protein
MAKPPVNRTAFAGAGASNLATFATPVHTPPSAPLVTPAPAPKPAAVEPDELSEVDDTIDDDTDVEPAPKKRKPRTRSPKIVAKSFPMTATFVDELMESRKQWHMADPSRIDHFGGMASENAFVQALCRLAMERIAVNEKDARRLMRFFPENTRTR